MKKPSHSIVPHLTTANKGPLQALESHVLQYQATIETWFRQQWALTPPPFYASTDLRNAGFKVAPVDTNLFPAGFNNLNPDFEPLCIQAIQATLEKTYARCVRILIIPENNTRNFFYLDNVATLQQLLRNAGYEVHVGSLIEGLTTSKTIALPSGKSLTLNPVQRINDRLVITDFDPCLIILNNDLSEGTPDILHNIKQAIIPPINMGWNNRLKSSHFAHYGKVAEDFSTQIGIDPWLVNPLFSLCDSIDFENRKGEETLATSVDHLLSAIQKKYQQYNIQETPFVFVKADAGTYGMGVMTAHSGEDILKMNRKQRNKMSKGKGRQQVQRVIIQEGIHSYETMQEGSVAEPVVYMIGHYVVGGFYRVHSERSPTENLNAPGMHFEPLAFANCCINPDKNLAPDAHPNRFYLYGVIARLALLAAAREIHATEAKQQ